MPDTDSYTDPFGFDTLIGAETNSLANQNGQNQFTGRTNQDVSSYVSQFSNRLFGAPFQLLDSVDMRVSSVNPYLGNEYLRQIMLNSPILYLRPGMPKYTGDNKPTSLMNIVRTIYQDQIAGSASLEAGTVGEIAGSLIFGNKGKQLQGRMFGFRETYYAYIQYVNYMCRSVAKYMNLSGDSRYPSGVHTSEGGGMTDFSSIDWKDYRMLAETSGSSPSDTLSNIGSAVSDQLVGIGAKILQGVGTAAGAVLDISTAGHGDDILESLGIGEALQSANEVLGEAWNQAASSSILEAVSSKISTVEFMVEPSQFEENLTNDFVDSQIESAVDAITNGLGNEIAFITNSSADLGAIESLVGFLGNTVESAATALGGLVENVSGASFVGNLFSGALGSIKGQKMIYPKIYQKSNSETNYQFTVTLTSPYGDAYNYYMNIVVPLLHLIALTAPRLVSSNSTTSPFLVQAYIPGMCTVQLGAITSMIITKNPDQNHVSVDGYPLTVKVTFTITELYNSMAISPINDPASFLYNETLNDYLTNLAGLVPSIDTYVMNKEQNWQTMSEYMMGGFVEDIKDMIVQPITAFTQGNRTNTY